MSKSGFTATRRWPTASCSISSSLIFSQPTTRATSRACRPRFATTLTELTRCPSRSIYEWEKNLRINRFANGSPSGVPITTLRFVNEDDIGLLLTASGSSCPFCCELAFTDPLLSPGDGHVRLFRHYESPSDVKLVSSFQGISETIPTTTDQHDAGLVVEWQQGRGQALMGGNVKYIRVWDATRETILQVRLLSLALEPCPPS